jgi:hypothetical protein
MSGYQSIHENQKALLSYLFAENFGMSSDLQLLIIDYVFYRNVKEIDYEDETKRCWLRIGVIFSEDTSLWRKYLTMNYKRIYYEIRIYNQKEGQILSSFCLNNESLAVLAYEAFCNIQHRSDITQRVHSELFLRPKNIFNGYMIRFCYSPAENCTYRIYCEETIILSVKVGLVDEDGCCDTVVYEKSDYCKHSDLGKSIKLCCEMINQRHPDTVQRRLKPFFDQLKIERNIIIS